MSDVEWYLESAGVRKGPYSARQIIDMMKGGEVEHDALVTTARMQGDWVTVGDLAEAYAELNPRTKPKPAPAKAEDGFSTFSGTGSGSRDQFQAPPRPTEQLEASKLIVVHHDHEENVDATEGLFAAIQAIRDKHHVRAPGAVRDRTGEPARSVDAVGGRIPPQTAMLLAVIVVASIAIYGGYRLFSGSGETPTAVAEKPAGKPVTPASPLASDKTLASPTAPGRGRLLSEGSRTAEPSVRTAPPVQRNPIRPSRVEGYSRRTAPREPPPEVDSPPEPESTPEQPPDLENTPPEIPHPGVPDGQPPEEGEAPADAVAPSELNN